MNIRIYLVSVDGLEDDQCFEKALACLDQTRYNKVCSCKRQKDQCLGIAAGLLLQVAYQKLLSGYEQNENIVPYTIETLLQVLQGKTKEIHYTMNKYGKPYWDIESGDHKFFSVSHSGSYVMVACSDYEIGVDIQCEKQARSMEHTIHEFSMLESYVKCKGTGFSGEGLRVLDYLMHQKVSSKEKYNCTGVDFYQLDSIEEYIAWICTKKTF